MPKVKRDLLDITELEHLDLRTVSENGQRFYCDDLGRKYPSVTTVVGLHSKEQIKLWRKRVGEDEANKITSRATNRGSKFHAIVEEYLRDETDNELVFDNILQEQMFNSIRPVLDGIVPLAIEAPLFSDHLRMAGRVDCVGIFEDVLAIIDFKTSSKYKEERFAKPWFMQMTAYSIMVEELAGNPVPEIAALVAVEGTGQFQLFVSDPRDHVDDLMQVREQYKNLYGV